MRRPRLSTLLVIINVGVLLLAVAGVAVAAASLLQQFADEQALARVAQASATARQELTRAGEDALISARLLGERPTLLRLLQANARSSFSDLGRAVGLSAPAVAERRQIMATINHLDPKAIHTHITQG